MIHICFALYDPSGEYSKYIGISACSIFLNTNQNVTIHILHDDTLSEENREKFLKLCENYGQNISFHKVNKNIFKKFELMTGRFSIGTLYRLALIEFIPKNVERVIYLDADTFCMLDISELWNIDLGNNSIGACIDWPQEKDGWDLYPCNKGIVKKRDYFNAGVLLLDLKRIRQRHSLLKESIDFLNGNPECTMSDQDALNVIFVNEKMILPNKFNRLFSILTEKEYSNEFNGILHFAGRKLYLDFPHWWDEKVLNTWSKTPWGEKRNIERYMRNIIELHGKQLIMYQKILMHSRKAKKCIVWGAKSVMLSNLNKILCMDPQIDYLVDGNKEFEGKSILGLQVYSPDILKLEKKEDIFVVVAAKKAFYDIKSFLESMDYKDNVNFFDGRLLLTQNEGGYLANV